MSIDGNKISNKDELIAKMYTLRAGLSAISQEIDQIKMAENEIALYETKNKEKKAEIEMLYQAQEEENAQAKAKYHQQIQNIKNEIADKESLLRKYETESISYRGMRFEKSWDNKSLYFVMYGAFLLLTLFNLDTILLDILDLPIGDVDMQYIYILWPGAAAILIYILYRFLIRYWSKKDHKTAVTRRQNAIQQYRDEIAQLKAELASMKPKAARNKYTKMLDVNAYEKEINAAKRHLTDCVLPAVLYNIKVIKAAINQQFDPIIAESDWKNVDLIIFYLNTGRADSLKEALLLVDKQRHADALVAAIADASCYIAQTSKENTRRLAEAMSVCMDELNNQIVESHNKLLDAIVISTAELSESSFVDTSSMDKLYLNNALIDQSKKSVAELLDELDRYAKQSK